MSKEKKAETDAMTDIAMAVCQGVFYLIVAGVFLMLTLAVSLGKLEIALKDNGETWQEILKKKLSFLLGILPVAMLVAIVVGYFNMDKKIFSGEDNHPTTEKDFRVIAEKKQNQLKHAKFELADEKRKLEYAKDHRAWLKRDIRNARTIEEKSEAEEEFQANEQKIAKLQAAIPPMLPLIKERERQLSIARENLRDFRDGTYRRSITYGVGGVESKSMSITDKFWVYFHYVQLVFKYLGISLALSYLAGFLWPEKNNRFATFAHFSFVAWEMVSRFGMMPLNFIMPASWGAGQVKKSKYSHLMKIGSNREAYLTDKNLNYHTQVIGGSGAGKTNLLKVMIEDRVRKGHGVIFFDFKADIELMDWMTGLSEEAVRRNDLMMISMSDPKLSHTYNPIELGSETEITSQIMNSFTWSESFYRDVAESGLMIINKAFCFRRDKGGKSFFLNDLYAFLTDASFRMDLLGEILNLNYPERFRVDLRRVCEELSTNKKDNYQGLINQLSKIMNSTAGEIVSGTPHMKAEFSFKDAIRDGKIAYLFMNSLKLKETAGVMGKLMLQDLMKTVGNIYDDRDFKKRPITLIIDEFASFATPDFGEFIEKARGAGIGVIVAYQSRQSLNSIEGDLALKINENTANKVVFQVQDSDDAQWFCGLLGTQKIEKETHQAEEQFLFGDKKTGMKSVREVEEYIVHPNQLKNLRAGEALLVSTKVDPHFGIMKINLASEYSSRYSKISKRKGHFSGLDHEEIYPGLMKKKAVDLRPSDLV